MKLPLLFLGLVALSACGDSGGGDPHIDAGAPNTVGSGAQIRAISDPTAPTHLASGTPVTLTAATTVIVDNFDETRNGKSAGTVYLQDFESNDPYSGISLFQPSFEPTDLHLGPGDAVDLTGKYQENNTIPVTFPPNEFLIQIARPQVKLRFDYNPPTPRVIDIKDLGAYSTGRKWLSMLVTVNDVTIPAASTGLAGDGAGRFRAYITSAMTASSPTMTNELFDLATWNATSKVIVPGAHFASITGLVTYFGFKGSFSQMHIAPRGPADLVQ